MCISKADTGQEWLFESKSWRSGMEDHLLQGSSGVRQRASRFLLLKYKGSKSHKIHKARRLPWCGADMVTHGYICRAADRHHHAQTVSLFQESNGTMDCKINGNNAGVCITYIHVNVKAGVKFLRTL